MARKAKVALIAPRIITSKNQVRRSQPPLGLACVAAVLEKRGHNVFIIDSSAEGYENVNPLINNPDLITYGLSDRVVAERIADFSPDIVGISILFSAQAECAFSLARSVDDILPDVPIVLGGIHASKLYKQILEKETAVDFIITGEADYTFSDFVHRIVNRKDFSDIPGLAWRFNSKIVHNRAPSFIKDLDELPFPAWHLLDMEKYFDIGMPHNPFVKSNRVGCILTSRGCPEHCYFCSSSDYFGHQFRPLSANRVIHMIEYLVDRFKIKEIQIEDDTFTLNHQRVIEICKGIIKLNLRLTLPNGIRADAPKSHEQRFRMFQSMRETGFEQISISCEHGDQEFLNSVIGKRLKLSEAVETCKLAHRAGLLVHASFMMGFPFETAEHRKRTAEFARNLEADSFSVSLAAPLPGTELWKLVEQNDLFLDSFDVNRILYSNVSIKPHDISPHDLYKFVEKLNRELNDAGKKRSKASEDKYKLFMNKDPRGDRKYSM